MRHCGLIIAGAGIIFFAFLGIITDDSCCIKTSDGDYYNPISLITLFFIIFFIMKSVSIKTRKKLKSRHGALYSKEHGTFWSVLSWVGVGMIAFEFVDSLFSVVNLNDVLLDWIGYTGLVLLVVSIIKIDMRK